MRSLGSDHEVILVYYKVWGPIESIQKFKDHSRYYGRSARLKYLELDQKDVSDNSIVSGSNRNYLKREGPDVQIRLRSPLSFFFPTSIRDGELDSDDEHGHDDEAEHDEEDGAECKADRATGRYIRA